MTTHSDGFVPGKGRYSDDIEAYFTTTVAKMLDGKNHKQSAKVAIDALKSKWDELDFFCIVYNGMKKKETKKHAMAGFEGLADSAGGYKFFYKLPVNHGKVNVVLAWRDRTINCEGFRRRSWVSFPHVKDETVLRRGIRGIEPELVRVHTVYKGRAEEFDLWKDLTCVLESLTDSKPSSSRFIWVAKKKQGVSRAQSNNQRLNWINGRTLDIAIFE